MNWLKNKIADLGQNIQFVAFFAHAGVAYFILSNWPYLWLVVGITLFGLVKEFYFDAKYEKDPPQTFMDNLEDFVGYVGGAWLGYWFSCK